jgi:cobalt-zinc-cadmium efflux system outer membrane protein
MCSLRIQPWRPGLGLLLGSCILACQAFEPMPLAPASSAAELEGRSLRAPELREFVEGQLGHPLEAWPPPAWTLETLTLAAFHFSPALALARAEWDAARAGVESAAGRPNPTLSVSPQYAANAESGVSPWLAIVNLDWPIETAGKRGHRIAQAHWSAESSRHRLLATAWQVRATLRSGLVDLVAARERVRLLERQLGIERALVDLLEARLAAGAISRPEVLAVRLPAARTAADLATARRQRSEARVAVAEAVGVPVRALRREKLAFPLAAPAEAVTLSSREARHQALQGRADVLSALADFEASQAALQLEIARQFPDVHLGPGYEFDQGTDKWGLGLFVELPLLNRNEGPIAEAEARRQEAGARFLALQATVLASIDHALASRAGAAAQLRETQELRDEEERRLGAARAALESGAADRVEVLSAELGLVQAELLHLDARTLLQRAAGDLEAAVQPRGGWQAAIQHESASAGGGA